MAMDIRIYLTALFSFAIKSYCEFQKQKEYKPLMFYLDECWMGINETFEYLLSFSRSFKVGLTLAHQGIHQFPDYKTIKKITSVCNTKVGFFPAGNDEARMLAESFGLVQTDFRELGKHEAGNQKQRKRISLLSTRVFSRRFNIFLVLSNLLIQIFYFQVEKETQP